MPRNSAIASALAAGVLFGTSTPLAKRLLYDIDSWMLAGLLYLGSGIGLAAYRMLHGLIRDSATDGPPMGADRWWLAGAILSGGIVAPVLMMYGLRFTAGSSASLLLNLEGVFSVCIAWFAFKENFDRRIATGVLLIFAGALLLSIDGKLMWTSVLGPLAVAGACLAWALDNNLTRKVALRGCHANCDAEGVGRRRGQYRHRRGIGRRTPARACGAGRRGRGAGRLRD